MASFYNGDSGDENDAGKTARRPQRTAAARIGSVALTDEPPQETQTGAGGNEFENVAHGSEGPGIQAR